MQIKDEGQKSPLTAPLSLCIFYRELFNKWVNPDTVSLSKLISFIYEKRDQMLSISVNETSIVFKHGL